ncbi:MAG TPA: SDR family NAD(P)-dependent oxidoreductase [Candidatus Binataceae bacterium]|nr:SDR family NAD(P)-dependent oxidoreductase [Candidatus Binataceae bacterium]
MDLHGKVAVVTGSSRGIGKRIALTLARSGADLVLSARTAEPGQSKLPGTINETAEEVRALGVKALPVRADLTIRDDVRRLYQTALEHFGRVDVLINNAAYIGKGMFESFLDTPLDSWDKHLGVDLIATLISIQMTLPQMMERKSGAIICLTTAIAVGDEDPRPAGQGGVGSVYPTVKAAVNRLCGALGKETRAYNIPVVALDPGAVLTERTMAAGQKGKLTTLTEPGSRVSMDVPAQAAHYICTCANPMEYNGKIVISEDLVRAKKLLPEAQIRPR